ncbi:putative aspartic proteinase GIP2 [Apium graveolens]|uniref:putative aspartic proteinase GIP2 n=1 Tax=Apium graveolens TaxID=4045 RepID=UPI003D7BE23F
MCGSTKCKQYNIKNAGCMICFGTVPCTPGCNIGACALSSVNEYASLSSGQCHMFIGGGPYYFPPYGKDITKELITTPIVQHPLKVRGFGIAFDPEFFYYVNVTSISVDHKVVSFNDSLLSIGKDAWGGTALSTTTTTTTFTILRDSIYEVLVSAFTKAAAFRKMKRVESVAPFGACYESKSVARSQTGPVVPYIDIGLAGNTHWRFYGANSMVSVNKDILCLAFVGAPVRTSSIVIGAYQMENYLIKFDLESSKLRISTSLLFRNTTCSQFRI